MVTQSFVLTRPVFFIGFMGAGKTTLTRRLARTLGLVSVDVDHFIEREQGASIKRLFNKVGEAAFRDIEAAALAQFATGEPKLISCGGGLVCGQASRAVLAQGFVIYMFVSPDESAGRISNHDTRPFFETMESVREVNAQRVPMYEELANATIDTTGKMPAAVAHEVQKLLMQEGVLRCVDTPDKCQAAENTGALQPSGNAGALQPSGNAEGLHSLKSIKERV